MADEAYVAMLRQGVKEWNAWREEFPDTWLELRGANLAGLDLQGANLFEANLRSANLEGAKLLRADLREASLQHASLNSANLGGADLGRAKFTGASLTRASLQDATLHYTSLYNANLSHAGFRGADLSGADLSGADLSGAYLETANLRGATLQRANLSHAIVRGTIFADVDLRDVRGLDTLQHAGPSTVGIDTLYLSGDTLPESFLRGCGLPDTMIEYYRSLVVRPIEYYSCFISYSSHDQALAERLHADLQVRGVRCWFALHDMQIGDSIIDRIDQAIRLHEKLLLILSESSVASRWVEAETKTAIMRERNEGRAVLFPIRLDDAVMQSAAGWAAQLQERHIGDFRQWKDHDAYQAAFTRLLRDLQATPDR